MRRAGDGSGAIIGIATGSYNANKAEEEEGQRNDVRTFWARLEGKLAEVVQRPKRARSVSV